jgi:hypothetical protein
MITEHESKVLYHLHSELIWAVRLEGRFVRAFHLAPCFFPRYKRSQDATVEIIALYDTLVSRVGITVCNIPAFSPAVSHHSLMPPQGVHDPVQNMTPSSRQRLPVITQEIKHLDVLGSEVEYARSVMTAGEQD